MLKMLISFLIAAISVSALSGCKHSGLPERPIYRECLAALDDSGQKIIRCRVSPTGEKESYPLTDGYLSQFIMVPLVDIPRLEKYEAELSTWIEKRCN